MLRRRPGPTLVLSWVLLLVLVQSLTPWAMQPLRPLEHALYDWRLRLLAPPSASQQIAIIDIDERSLALHGRWPWPRGLLADLLEAAAVREGARLIGLDLVLAEPDLSSGLATLDSLASGALRDDTGFVQRLQALRPALDNDSRLADALQRLPVVLGFHLSNEPGAARIGELPPALMPVALLGATGSALLDWTGHGGILSRLLQAGALGAGHLNALIDDDGTIRRLPLLVQYQGGVQPALALAMARALLAQPAAAAGSQALAPLLLEPAEPPLRALRLQAEQAEKASLRTPVDAQALAWVPFAAPGAAFDRYSAADLLAGSLPADALRGRVLLLGVSAPGLIDQRSTPVDPVMLGTQVHGHMLAGLLEGRALATPAAAWLIEAAWLLASGALLVWWLPRLKVWQGSLLSLGLLSLLLAGNLLLWRQAGLVLPLASSLLLPLLLLGTHLLAAYRRATLARRALAQLFGQYVPPELVARMSREPGRYTMVSRSAELTVLFADVAGFTSLAQRMSPSDISAMMNLLFSHLTEVLRAHGGTLDKYIGDAVMAFWGAPLDDPDHARHAVAAALAMRARLPAIQAELASRGWPALELNIGINTGSMVVGDMGSRHRRAYTVMGDAVNLAARLQDLCSRQRLGLVIGDATRAAIAPQLCLALGQVEVRGRQGLLPIWLPLPWRAGEDAQADALAARWAAIWQAQRDGRLAQARALLDGLPDMDREGPLYRWQVQQLLQPPSQAQPQPPPPSPDAPTP